MANFKGADITAPLDTFANTSDQRAALGTKQYTEDGRVFRYAQVGATATVAGSLYQSAAPVANHLANTPPAVAIGATSFTYTPGATAGAANLYAEGYMQVDTTPGNGYTYQVKRHAAISSSTAFTLYLKDEIQVALTTSSRVGLFHNKWKNVIVCPTTLTGALAGVAGCVITAVYYGWLQTGGRASVLIDSTAPAITATVAHSTNTAGAVMALITAALATAQIVGHAAQATVDAKNNFIDLSLDE
jgi:hypothetical protein